MWAEGEEDKAPGERSGARPASWPGIQADMPFGRFLLSSICRLAKSTHICRGQRTVFSKHKQSRSSLNREPGMLGQESRRKSSRIFLPPSVAG